MGRGLNKEAFSLDDVLLEPQFSNIESRLDTDVSTYLTTRNQIHIPVMATNMSTITEYDMMYALDRSGGVGALHRFLDPHQRLEIVSKAKTNGVYPIVASIGVGGPEFECAKQMVLLGADVILIDVAHGHSQAVVNQLKVLQEYRKQTNHRVDIIVGNIATEQAAKDFLSLGADGLRVGIGGGSRCLTRTVTGHGVPNLTAIKDVAYARDDHYHRSKQYVPIIIDGGLKNSGDVVKALYFGADVACFGGLFAGTAETPGEVVEADQGKFKKFYGMASKEAQDTHRNGLKPGTAAEGFSELVPYKGSVRPIIEALVGGIRSGLTYSGARNIKELRQKGSPVYITGASQHESKIR